MSWFTDLAKKIRNSKLIDMGFCRNQWLWFHIFAGALLFNILVACGVVWTTAMWITFAVAIFWEFVEFFVENGGKWENVKKNYGSIEKWKYDTIGDVLGVVLIVLITLIGILL